MSESAIILFAVEAARDATHRWVTHVAYSDPPALSSPWRYYLFALDCYLEHHFHA